VVQAKSALQQVIEKLENSGYHHHGPSKAEFYLADVLRMRSALTLQCSGLHQAGRPQHGVTAAQAEQVRAHFALHGTGRSRELAQASGLSRNKAWRLLVEQIKENGH
jgi:hypothetical protein